MSHCTQTLVAAWPVRTKGGLSSTASRVWATVHAQCQAEGAAWHVTDVQAQLQKAQAQAELGRIVLLGLAFEAAPAFDAAMVVNTKLATPGKPWPLFYWAAWNANDIKTCAWNDIAYNPTASIGLDAMSATAATMPLEPWQDVMDSDVYAQHFAQLQAAIAQGEFYQLNLTTRLHSHAEAPLNPWVLFCQLWQRQPAEQALFWRTPYGDVLSLSPELFVHWYHGHVEVAPMKGTRRPMVSRLEDGPSVLSTMDVLADENALADSTKDRAENVMIVDLLRNDLAKICEPRSVQVRSLFDVMHLPTVQQMTSRIVGRTLPGVGLFELLQALFPCGSITGAPKVQAMQRIAQWEPGARGWYCGALGVLNENGRNLQLNVPIRTVFLQEQKQATYGVGSGCTWYSSADDERREWWLKAELLHTVAPPLQLFETVRLEQGRWVFGNEHLARLARSAAQLGFVCQSALWQKQLGQYARENSHGVHRGRWVLSTEGALQISCAPMPSTPASVALQLAHSPCTARALWLRHKTTYRPHYDAALLAASPGVFDVLLYNKEGLLTETCRANLLVQLDGQWFTPKQTHGLREVDFLPGVYRGLLLRNHQVQETALTFAHLHCAQAIAVLNSLRGVVPVHTVMDANLTPVWQGKPLSLNEYPLVHPLMYLNE